MSEFLKQLMGANAPNGETEVRAVRAGPETAARMEELHEAFQKQLKTTELTSSTP